MAINIPQIHVPRADGGYETRPVNLGDILGWVRDAQPATSDLLTLIHNAIAAFNAKSLSKTLDLLVASAETAADVAEEKKVGAASEILPTGHE